MSGIRTPSATTEPFSMFGDEDPVPRNRRPIQVPPPQNTARACSTDLIGQEAMVRTLRTRSTRAASPMPFMLTGVRGVARPPLGAACSRAA